MSENNGTVNQEFVQFLISQTGGKEKAESAFRKHFLRNTFKGRVSSGPSGVTTGEILSMIEKNGWSEWLLNTNFVEFMSVFVDRGAAPTNKTVNPKSNGTKRRPAALQKKLDMLMDALVLSPWLSKTDIARLWGLKSLDRVNKITKDFISRGLIKQHRCHGQGRKIMFALAEQSSSPPA